MAKKKQEYDNESIELLEGADRVRKRPAVIFGSDGLEGCKHSVFEILSNSIDEARSGHGNKIILTKFADGSFQVCPPRSRAGDQILLEALADVTLGVAACSVSESNCNAGGCTAVLIEVE